MHSAEPKGPSGNAPPWPPFPGFRPLTANFSQISNEIFDLKHPGLTGALRWTLVALNRETAGYAYRRGGSPYDFVPISWNRWLEILDKQNRNTVKTQLALLEEMGFIEVLPGERGPWGTTANRYRLRWDNDGKPASRTFHQVVRTRDRELARRHGVGLERDQVKDDPGGSVANPPPSTPGGSAPNPPPAPGGSPANPPPRTPGEVPRRTPPGGTVLTTPSFKENKYRKTKEDTQSVSPSVPAGEKLTDGRTDGIPFSDFDDQAWRKAEDSRPWPEPLLQGLGEFLHPLQIGRAVECSPWGPEGAWAILQAIRSKGRNLSKQTGTLCNALLSLERGRMWLAQAGPMLRQAGWQEVPEDETPAADFLRALAAKRLAKEGYRRLPLYGGAVERRRQILAPASNREYVDLVATYGEPDYPDPCLEEGP